MLFGWVPAHRDAEARGVVAGMGRVLRPDARTVVHAWAGEGFGIGILDLAPLGLEAAGSLEPACGGDRYRLWLSGEAFEWPSRGGPAGPEASRTLAFRNRLLEAILRDGIDAIRDLDGEYQMALWDAVDRRLTLLNDRFGALPLYWGASADGFAFGGGVRGVLVAPGIQADPDVEAIREAVTFGGFRLGTRTNVRGVRMVPGATALEYDAGRIVERRYWTWRDIPARPMAPVEAVVEELRREWRRAVGVRLQGSARPGLTLSGGLDSRAILAEAAEQHAVLQAVTYGHPDSDDVRIAQQAARAVGAGCAVHPLFSGTNPDWLERRASFIQATDGLMDLVDLMHVEALDLLRARADLNLSGYIGDAVVGPTFNGVRDAAGVALALPYYGGRLGLPWDEAVARTSAMIERLDGAPPRFAVFEHKLPQSTNRITAALRPYVRVRRPFVDYRVFDLAQGQPAEVRGDGGLQARWLRSSYPRCFARIRHQKTQVPVLAPEWQRQAVRASRYAYRRAAAAAAGAGLPVRVPQRLFHLDHEVWRQPAWRAVIEGEILRPDAISGGVFGRENVAAVVNEWFAHEGPATQVIGALFVFERYHRELAATVREGRSVGAPENECSLRLC